MHKISLTHHVCINLKLTYREKLLHAAASSCPINSDKAEVSPLKKIRLAVNLGREKGAVAAKTQERVTAAGLAQLASAQPSRAAVSPATSPDVAR